MKWLRRRSTEDVPPLDVPDDLDSGSVARTKALERLQSVVADEQSTMWQRVLDRIVQENHIQDYLREANRGRG
jgi:hypothetical protein